MGFLKKLYGEAQKVRHSGNLGKELHQIRHGRADRLHKERQKRLVATGGQVMREKVKYESPSRPGNRGFGIAKMRW